MHGEFVATSAEMTRKFPGLLLGRLNPVALGQRRQYKGWTCEQEPEIGDFLFNWKLL